MNCRSFQSGVGLLPTPVKSFSTPSSKKASSAVHSYETPSPSVNENLDCSKGNVGSRIIPIAIKINFENEESGFCYSELWAGPAYSNSPPPSSLPLPNFFLQPKGTCSLDLRSLSSEIHEKPIAKSAPAYPRRYRCPSPGDPFDRDEELVYVQTMVRDRMYIWIMFFEGMVMSSATIAMSGWLNISRVSRFLSDWGFEKMKCCVKFVDAKVYAKRQGLVMIYSYWRDCWLQSYNNESL